MTDAVLSQLAIEVIRLDLSPPEAKVSQIAVEVVRPNTAVGFKLTATGGSFVLNGNPVKSGRTFVVRTGSFAFSYKTAKIYQKRKLIADSGAFTLSGKASVLVRRIPNRLFANPGAFTFTGSPVRPLINAASLAGSFTLFGGGAKVTTKRILRAEPPEFTLSLKPAHLAEHTLTRFYGGGGAFTLTTTAARLVFTWKLQCSGAAFGLQGGAASFRRNRNLKAGPGEFTFAGCISSGKRPSRVLKAVGCAEYVLGETYGYPYKHSNGPFYFAWADSHETDFSAHHMRYDEHVFAFTVSHEEGQIPTLEIEIRNPRIGLLNAARQQWVWFSWDDGTELHKLFYGRLVAVSGDLLGEAVTLQFVARANDYLDQKYQVAQGLKAGPEYDPLFLDAKSVDDPDAILEGYSASWHVDRTTLDWSASDIITPEDGVVVFDPADVFYDSVKINVGQPPLKSVQVSTTVSWGNTAYAGTNLGHWVINTYLGSAILSEWPQNGTDLGGGWVAENSYCIDYGNVANAQVVEHTTVFKNGATVHAEGDTMSATVTVGEVVGTAAHKYELGRKVTQTWSDSSASGSEVITYALNSTIVCGLSVRASSTRNYSESLIINVNADVQGLLFDTAVEQEAELIEINAGDITDSSTLSHYFATDRGNRSVQYMLMRARARLLTRARAVDVSWQTTFRNGANLSCRMGAQVSDPRLPGGAVSGKITSYALRGNGDSGEFITDIKVGAAVGHGRPIVEPNAGVETYADEYSEIGYTVRTGVVEAIGASGIGFTPVNDPAHNLSLTSGAGATLMMEYGWPFEKYFVNVRLPDISNQEFSASYDVMATALEVPKGIDLEAPHVTR